MRTAILALSAALTLALPACATPGQDAISQDAAATPSATLAVKALGEGGAPTTGAMALIADLAVKGRISTRTLAGAQYDEAVRVCAEDGQVDEGCLREALREFDLDGASPVIVVVRMSAVDADPRWTCLGSGAGPRMPAMQTVNVDEIAALSGDTAARDAAVGCLVSAGAETSGY